MIPSRITLGTAQLGLSYGIANSTGKPCKAKAFQLLNQAFSHGINSFDTAPAYGDSESIIGEWIKLESLTEKVLITSKIPSIRKAGINRNEITDFILKSVQLSCERLNKCLDYCLLHCFEDYLLFPEELTKAVEVLKQDKLISKFGLSMYSPVEEAKNFADNFVEAVQIPLNAFNHEFLNNGYLENLKNHGIQIFARSVFLQGLFALSDEMISDKAPKSLPYLKQLQQIANNYKLSILELAAGFLNHVPSVDSIVLGMDNIEQLESNMSIMKASISDAMFDCLIREFLNVPVEIYDPRFW